MGDLQVSGQGGTCRTGAGGRASTPGRGDGDGHVPHPWKRIKEFGWDPGYPGGDALQEAFRSLGRGSGGRHGAGGRASTPGGEVGDRPWISPESPFGAI